MPEIVTPKMEILVTLIFHPGQTLRIRPGLQIGPRQINKGADELLAI